MKKIQPAEKYSWPGLIKPQRVSNASRSSKARAPSNLLRKTKPPKISRILEICTKKIFLRPEISIFRFRSLDHEPGNSAVPRVLQIVQREAAVLRKRLLAFEGVLGPHPLRVEEFALPGLNVAVEVRDEGLLVVRHAGPVGVRG